MVAPSAPATEQKPALPPALQRRLAQIGRTIGLPLGSVVFAFLIGAVIVYVTGGDPVHAYQDLLCGGFGVACASSIYPIYQISTTVVQAILLVLTGMAVAIAFKAGLFNIGAEGQLIAGAIVATLLGVKLATLPSILLIPLVLLGGMVGGAVWGGIAGVLKAYIGAHEVVTTIMLNWVAIYLAEYLVTGGPFALPTAGGNPRSPAVGANALLPPLIPTNSTFLGLPGAAYQLSIGLFIAIAAVIVFWFLLSRTTLGYEIKAVGQSQRAARYAGINVRRTIIVTMLIAGAFAGLAGAIFITGNPVQPYLTNSFITDTTGFDAITVALLGLNSPIGVTLGALLIGGLYVGKPLMQSDAHVDGNLVYVLQALILFAIAANFLRTLHLRLPALRKVPPSQSNVEPGVAAYATDVEPSATVGSPDAG
jgi:general nucleoside transport system permease protein